MARLEFPLAQAWYKGLTLHFEDKVSSKDLLLDSSFLYVKQVHGKKIHICSESDLNVQEALSEADGLCADGDFLKKTKKKLLIQTADCLPLVFIETLAEKVALVHAGWRGLVQGIHLEPFQRLQFDPRSTLIWVGPSLNGMSFEVGADVWKSFGKFSNDEEVFQTHPSDREKRFFFVWKYLEKLYASLKVPMIYNCEVNTFEDSSFASYRRAKKENSELLSKERNYSWLSF